MKIAEMIEKFNNSKTGMLIKAIVLLVFSAAMITTVTLAWFYSNVSTTSGGMSLSVYGENSYGKYSAFYIEDIDTKEVIKGAQSNTTGVNRLDVSLRTYDKTFTSVNEYAPIVIRMELYEIEDRFIPTGDEVKQLNVIISRDTSVDTGTSEELCGIFSSIGQLGCYSSNGLELSSDNQTIYDTVIAQYRQDQNLHTFTTITNNSFSKVSDLVITVSYTASNFKTDEEDNSCLVIYMVADYNVELTEAYLDQNLNELSGLNNQEESNIANDLTSISIDFI